MYEYQIPNQLEPTPAPKRRIDGVKIVAASAITIFFAIVLVTLFVVKRFLPIEILPLTWLGFWTVVVTVVLAVGMIDTLIISENTARKTVVVISVTDLVVCIYSVLYTISLEWWWAANASIALLLLEIGFLVASALLINPTKEQITQGALTHQKASALSGIITGAILLVIWGVFSVSLIVSNWSRVAHWLQTNALILVLGLLMLVMAGVVTYLYVDNRRLHKAVKSLQSVSSAVTKENSPVTPTFRDLNNAIASMKNEIMAHIAKVDEATVKGLRPRLAKIGLLEQQLGEIRRLLEQQRPPTPR